MPIKVQETYRTPDRLDQKRESPHHIIIKTLNIQNKERILKAAREKDQVIYKGRPIRIKLDFSISMKNVKARRSLTTLRDPNASPYFHSLSNTFIHNRWRKYTFHDKTKVKHYLSTNPALQKVLEEKLQLKDVNHT